MKIFQATRPGSFVTPTHSANYQPRLVAARSTSGASATPTIGDSKVSVEQKVGEVGLRTFSSLYLALLLLGTSKALL